MLNYNVIIFHVVNKVHKDQLEANQVIPSKIKVTASDGVSFNVLTDIEEVGNFQFQFTIGDPVDDITVGKQGTLGLFLTDGANAYALTNYHVAGWNLMSQGEYYYDNTLGLAPDNLTIAGNNGLSMYKGQLSKTIDAAFISIGPPTGVINDLGNGNIVNNNGFVDPDTLNPGDQLYAYRTGVAGGETVTVVSNSTSYDPQYQGITFDRVIALNRYSNPGDSGSLVVSRDFKVVGIIVGADKYSYLIPFSAIYSFNPLLNII